MDERFSERVKEIAYMVGGVAKLARKAGITANAVRSYIIEGRDPKRKVLIGLANAAEVNLLWLAVGEGPQKAKGVYIKEANLKEWLLDFYKKFPEFEVSVNVRGTQDAGDEEREKELVRKLGL